MELKTSVFAGMFVFGVALSLAACGDEAEDGWNPPPTSCDRVGKCSPVIDFPDRPDPSSGHCIRDIRFRPRSSQTDLVRLACANGGLFLASKTASNEEFCMYDEENSSLTCGETTIDLREPCSEPFESDVYLGLPLEPVAAAFIASGCTESLGRVAVGTESEDVQFSRFLETLTSVGSLHFDADAGVELNLRNLRNVDGSLTIWSQGALSYWELPSLKRIGGSFQASSEFDATLLAPKLTTVAGGFELSRGVGTNTVTMKVQVPELREIGGILTLRRITASRALGWDFDRLEAVGGVELMTARVDDAVFKSLTTVNGKARFHVTQVDSNVFPVLTNVEHVEASISLGVVTLPYVTSVPGDVTVRSFQADEFFDFSMPALTEIGGDLVIEASAGDAESTYVDFQSLEHVEGGLTLSTSVPTSLAKLATIGGELVLNGASTSNPLPALVEAKSIAFRAAGNFSSITLPLLERVLHGVLIGQASRLTSVSLPKVVSTPSLRIENNTYLQSFSMGALESTSSVYIVNNTKLQTLSLPALRTISNGGAFDVYGNSALRQAQVNEIYSALSPVPGGTRTPNY